MTKHHYVIEQVPIDYYQKGVKNNFLQKAWHTRKLKTVLDLIPSYPEKILDVGCASGWFLSRVSRKYPRASCYGVDLYDKAVQYGWKHYPHINFQVADAHALPFKDETFDLVISTEVLEHLDDPKTALAEIKRVLKKGGVAVVELDSGSLLFSLCWYMWRKLKGAVWNDAHLHSFNPAKLERAINQVGLKTKKKKKFNLGMGMSFLVVKE